MSCWIIQASKPKSARTRLGMQQGLNSAIEVYSIKGKSNLDSFRNGPRRIGVYVERGFFMNISTISFKQINLEKQRKNKKNIFL